MPSRKDILSVNRSFFSRFFCKFATVLKNHQYNMLHRSYKSLLMAFAVCLMSGCMANSAHKPLIGGIKDSVDGTEERSQSGQTDKKSTKATVADALEIPAPLKGIPEQMLKRTGYTVSYNSETKLPNWVAWHLTAAHTGGQAKRPRKAFHEDEDVEEPRATDWDYYNSRYDRGHMCPAGDNKWREEAMMQSFLFTNICPQAPSLNRGDWNEMENMCRKWAKEYGDVYIVCGPVLYKGRHKTIGKNKVVVPEAFFKVVLCMKGEPKAIGFIYKNGDGNRPKGDYVNSVDQVERITGFDFFPKLPDSIEKRIEAAADASEWGLV